MTYLDPATAAIAEAEAKARLPFIAPEEFYITYVDQPDGSKKAVEWVRWVKKGMTNPTAVPERIKDLMKNPKNPTWAVLEPYYKKWKEGQEAPVNGTPLDAWMADPKLVKVLNGINIRSVEDFAAVPESDLAKIALPGLRDKQKRAQQYLHARSGTAGIADQMAQLASDLESQKRENAALRDLIEKYAIKQEQDVEPVKRGPGRPRKEPEAA